MCIRDSFGIALCLPFSGFHAESRFSLLQTLVESAVSPIAPVTFWHVIVADYLTSMAKAFADLQLTACISARILGDDAEALAHGGGGHYQRSTRLWEVHHDSCFDSNANAIMLALPFWIRLMQCLKVYSETRETKNLWNALKYSTAFPLVCCLLYTSPSPRDKRQSRMPSSA